ncbi:hypothetical protein [Croceicoccus gelatinilyticus]|uniref:hypothetical protein n=1 Tax=Croceicoccus gelatinilyticus TaxID=2835536 RepID=UPI001BCDBE03|nr:hypothetical protein [Croceicoccus gelatinilyticus]MBS7671744.1 hypothetical protein [Croceicoccus gelatinilyticus]
MLEVPDDEDAEEYAETARPVRQRRVIMNVAEIDPEPIKALYLVRGHDVDGENQDCFVVAESVDQATQFWNEKCLKEEWMRESDDDGDDETIIYPAHLRIILEDVAATPYDGEPRAIDWGEIPIVD